MEKSLKKATLKRPKMEKTEMSKLNNMGSESYEGCPEKPGDPLQKQNE